MLLRTKILLGVGGLLVVFAVLFYLYKRFFRKERRMINLFGGEAGFFERFSALYTSFFSKNKVKTDVKDIAESEEDVGGSGVEKEGEPAEGDGSEGGQGSGNVEVEVKDVGSSGLEVKEKSIEEKRKKLNNLIKDELKKIGKKVFGKKGGGTPDGRGEKVDGRGAGSGGGSGGGGVPKKTFRVSSVEDISKVLQDEGLIYILKHLAGRKYDVNKGILNRDFSSKRELYDFLKEGLVNFLQNEHDSLKDKISGFRREGKNVVFVDLKLKMVPSKIKVFESTMDKKDFDKVISLVEKIEDILRVFEKESVDAQAAKAAKEKAVEGEKSSPPVEKLSSGKGSPLDKNPTGEKLASGGDLSKKVAVQGNVKSTVPVKDKKVAVQGNVKSTVPVKTEKKVLKKTVAFVKTEKKVVGKKL